MFRFANPEFLYLLILIPVLAFLNLYAGIRRKKAINDFGDPSLLSALMPDASANRPVVKFYFLLLSFILLIVTLAQPQFGSKLENVKRKGIELMICLDVSNSMNATDIEPNRLERAKQAIARLTDQLRNDKLGIIVFAGQAYTQLPITTDYPSAKMFLNSISTGMVPVQGTAIGAAINRAANSFSQQENVSKAIIVITDGENHEDNPVEEAKKAAEKGIRIYTVGMGLAKGSPIPVSPNSTNEFMKDRQGNVVISKLDETTLKEIALVGSGNYIPANDIRNGIKQLVDDLGELQKSEIESKVYTEYDDQFMYFAFMALFLILADAIIIERKNRYLKQFKLFNVGNDKLQSNKEEK
ncbi:MAG: VWA domain-containing protein [Breznakibacter sp.]